mgnify:CR=1 FL=1
MISEYIEKAMLRAVYEKLEDGSYCGEIHNCPGTIAFASTLADCKKELRSVLEDWLLIGIRHSHEIPVIDGIDLNLRKVAAHE